MCPANLTKLVISNCSRVPFDDIKSILNHCTKLEVLEMRRVTCITDRLFISLPVNRGIMSKLTCLDLWGCNVYDKGILAICNLTTMIRELNLSDTKISDVSLTLLANKQLNLRSLALRKYATNHLKLTVIGVL